jgi:NTP pyrophosphatase (non-canonical NTP hydrolase)
MIDLEKMAKEHEALFSHCDLASQMEKLREEKCEVQEAYRQYCKELADVLIVCAGIYRFDQKKAIEEMNAVYNICVIIGIDWEDIDKEVARKWEINKQRKWAWNGKTYHHIEE